MLWMIMEAIDEGDFVWAKAALLDFYMAGYIGEWELDFYYEEIRIAKQARRGN
jgi:hypothetical protein